LTVVVNEVSLIVDAIASSFVVFTVVEDLILLVGARVDTGVGTEFHALFGRSVESFVRGQTSSSTVEIV
jgi:hypothetical protein